MSLEIGLFYTSVFESRGWAERKINGSTASGSSKAEARLGKRIGRNLSTAFNSGDAMDWTVEVPWPPFR